MVKLKQGSVGYAIRFPSRDYPCYLCWITDHTSCDGWDSQFCCALCHYEHDEPCCEDCEPWDI